MTPKPDFQQLWETLAVSETRHASACKPPIHVKHRPLITFYLSSDLEAFLPYTLFDTGGAGDPLQPDKVIVPNMDMARWLHVQRAERQGVSANVDFRLPIDYLRSLYRLLDPDIDERLLGKDDLAWLIYRLLEEVEGDADFEELSSYVHAGEASETGLRRRQLSARIADVFDQYTLFRPQWLQAWQEGRQHADLNPHAYARWQMILWQRISASSGECMTYDRLFADLKHRIQQGELDGQLPGRLTVFALPSLPPVMVELLFHLAGRGRTDVEWMVLASHPDAPQQQSGHDLREKLGEENRSLIALLEQNGRQQDVETRWHALSTPGSKLAGGWLGRLQRDLLPDRLLDAGKEDAPGGARHRETGAPPDGDATDDGSLQVHACHSPLREVEVLYDNVLSYLDRHPDASASDILVMVPDMAAYAPFIEAVFGSPDNPDLAIPYHLSDPAGSSYHQVSQTLLRLARLPNGRLPNSEVMDLLDTDVVRRRFRLTGDDIALIEHWIRETRIRWGWDREHRGGIHQNSWQFGLERLLTGLAQPLSDAELYDGILPYTDLEGSAILDTLGRFQRFLEELADWRRFTRSRHTARQWSRRLGELISRCFDDQDEYAEAVLQVREAVRSLEEAGERWLGEQPIGYAAVLDWLEMTFQQHRSGTGFRSGTLTFASMVPMRGIPYRFIALLGMNEQQIPAKDRYLEFDLIPKEPKPGDRSRRATDRCIMLETVLAARRRLHLSYVGRSQHDNAVLPPSFLITDLLDHLEQLTGESELHQRLTIHHPLQSYNRRYLEAGPNGRLFTYSDTPAWLARSTGRFPPPFRLLDADLSEPEQQQLELDKEELVRFFQRPAGWLAKKRLGMLLREQEILEEERDPFSLTGLTRYRIRLGLIELLLKGEDTGPFEQQLRADGVLPYGEAGNRLLDGVKRDIQDMASRISGEYETRYHEPERVDFTTEAEGRTFRLTGRFANLTGEHQLLIHLGKTAARHELRAWIHHVMLHAAAQAGHAGAGQNGAPAGLLQKAASGRTILFTRKPNSKSKGLDKTVFLPPNDPAGQLESLLRLFQEGQTRPLLAYPEAGKAYITNREKEELDTGQLLVKAAAQFYGNDFNDGDLGRDPEGRFLLHGLNPFGEREASERFQEQAGRLWGELTRHKAE